MRQRLEDQGTCSIIARDAGRPVAQLYLRAHRPGFRSPGGLMDGAWWADLKGVPGTVSLPSRTALLGCWHVGRVRLPDGTEAEAEEYRGRGLGIALLEAAADWLRTPGSPFRRARRKGDRQREPRVHRLDRGTAQVGLRRARLPVPRDLRGPLSPGRARSRARVGPGGASGPLPPDAPAARDLAGCGESDGVGRDASDGRRAEQGEGSPFPVRTGSVSHG